MSQKVHKHLVDQLAQSLLDVFVHDRYADQIVERELKNQKKWGARDRRFFAENLYGTVRWWRRLWFLMDQEIPSPTQMNLEQMKRVWLCHWLEQGHPMPEGLAISLPSNFTKEKRIERSQLLKSDPRLLAALESIPDWMNAWGQSERGERWPTLLHSLNDSSVVDLRVNTLKTTRDQLQRKLAEEDVISNIVEGMDDTLTLPERKNVFITESYKQGWFEVQDRGSQQIVPLLPVEPGHRVIDACAGAGGKSLHLAARMKNKGKIIAMDIHERKLEELRKRASRNGVAIIETRPIEGSKTIKRLQETADAVLLDVPCSGMGVVRRNPDTKWKLHPEEIQKLLQTQEQILSSYSSMVKKGGHLVYATCSIMASENQNQVQNFLSGKPDWRLLRQIEIDPDQKRGDGFFAALLQRQ
jgi:16S rRNA (cytosine967-C5)-methyltransferase